MSSHFEFFKDTFSLLLFTPALDFAMDCPLRGDKMLRANAMSKKFVTSAGVNMLQIVISCHYKMHRTFVTSYKNLQLNFLSSQSVNITKMDSSYVCIYLNHFFKLFSLFVDVVLCRQIQWGKIHTLN